jgi:ribA/ribD-fused uncharacterized protein
MEVKLAEFQMRIEKVEAENEKLRDLIEKHEKIFQGFVMIVGGKKMKLKRGKAVCPPATDKVIRFGPTGDKDYGYLSLFYKAPFTLDGFEWPTLIHYLSGSKFIATDPEYAEVIRTTENSAMARSKGLNKTHKVDEEYDILKALKRALVAKFEQNDELAERLVKTDVSKTFEYESTKESYLGIGADGNGSNHFGKLLHEVRQEFLEIVEDA